MKDYQQLANLILESSRINSSQIIDRPIEKKLEQHLDTHKPVKVITGLRRTGKSFLLKKLVQKLLKDGVPRSNIFFINFEIDLAQVISNLDELGRAYNLFLSRVDSTKKVFLFLDEIQNIVAWERFVRRIYDSTEYNIFVTGSNSNLLSSDFSTVLGGRTLEFHVYPFSYTEYLTFKKANYKDDFEKAKLLPQLIKLNHEYLNYGGLPETLYIKDEDEKKSYAKSLIEKIIINDILKRYSVDNTQVLNTLIKFIKLNSGSIISKKNIAKYADSSDVTINKYIKYLKNTFLISNLKKIHWKTRELFDIQNKYYFVDNLFLSNAIEPVKLESMVYQHLMRLDNVSEIRFGRNEKGSEIDFIVKYNTGKYDLIQVCMELHDMNFKREVGNLVNVRKHIGSKDRLILLYIGNKLKIKEVPKFIQVIEVWDWMRFYAK